MLEIIGQCDVKHIMMLLIKTVLSVLKVSTCINTSITARPIGPSAILVIMSSWSLKTAIILYISWFSYIVSIFFQIFIVSVGYFMVPQVTVTTQHFSGPPWSRLYGSWIYNYLCNQYLSPLTLWVWTPLRWGVLDTNMIKFVSNLWQVRGFLRVLRFPPPIKLAITI